MSTEFRAFPYPGFDRSDVIGTSAGKSPLVAMYHSNYKAPRKLKRQRSYQTCHEMPYIFEPRPKFNRTHVMPENPQISLRDIMAAVSRVSCITIEDMKSHRRFQPLSQARFVFMWLARRYTGHSLPEIGRFLNMDHTSVMHGVARVEWNHNEFRELVEDAKSALAERLEAKG